MMMTFGFLHLKRQSDGLGLEFQHQLCREFVWLGGRGAAFIRFGIFGFLQHQFFLGLAAINNDGGLQAFYSIGQ